MQRREFMGKSLMVAGLSGPPAHGKAQAGEVRRNGAAITGQTEVVVDRVRPGKPHTGMALAAIQPHADDIPLFAGGTVSKLVHEGYTGYLIRTSNDECTGSGSIGEGFLSNERDNDAVAKALGLKQVFDLGYRNHRMDGVSRLEMRARLIFLFRLLKVDTVICYDPWGLYEENPDHYVTAQVVESACWMAGMEKDYPEHFAAGLQPHGVRDKYYFARGPQLVNRVVDISPWIEQKVEANLVNVTQGPAGASGARLKARLSGEKLHLPVLGNDDATANRQYIKNFVLDYDSEHLRGVPSDKEVGRPYSLEWAEAFHYIGPIESKLDRYISEHATRL